MLGWLAALILFSHTIFADPLGVPRCADVDAHASGQDLTSIAHPNFREKLDRKVDELRLT
jgi:hypothetical protein